MHTTDSEGRVIRWVPRIRAAWLSVFAFVAGVYVGRTPPHDPAATALQATRDSLQATHDSLLLQHDSLYATCTKAIATNDKFVSDLTAWMQFAHTTEHGAD